MKLFKKNHFYTIIIKKNIEYSFPFNTRNINQTIKQNISKEL